MQLPKIAIFDWDNTLVDSWPVIHTALNLALDAYGKPRWTLEETMFRVARSMRDAFPAMFGDQWEEAGAVYRQHYRSMHLTHLTPLPDADAILRSLQAQGVKLAIVSNKSGDILRKEVEQLGWTPRFTHIIGAGDLSADKPSPIGIETILKDTGISPQDCWFVGDSGIDVDCARAAGCKMVFYGDRFHSQDGEVVLEPEDLHIPAHHHWLSMLAS